MIRWTERAVADLIAIGEYIAIDKPDAARGWVERPMSQLAWTVATSTDRLTCFRAASMISTTRVKRASSAFSRVLSIAEAAFLRGVFLRGAFLRGVFFTMPRTARRRAPPLLRSARSHSKRAGARMPPRPTEHSPSRSPCGLFYAIMMAHTRRKQHKRDPPCPPNGERWRAQRRPPTTCQPGQSTIGSPSTVLSTASAPVGAIRIRSCAAGRRAWPGRSSTR